MLHSRLRAAATALLFGLALTACSSDGGGDGATPDAGGGGSPAPPGVVYGTPELGEACVTSDSCPGGFCDKRHGRCVQCYEDRHCPDGSICQYGACREAALCGDVQPCEVGLCAAGACKDCEEDAHCPDGLGCVDGVCRPPFPQCEAYADCAPLGAICGADGLCRDCEADDQCGDYETCDGGRCAPALCVPGGAACVGKEVQICRADGSGYSKIACEAGKTCSGGACIFDSCEPNTTRCNKWQLEQCTADGQLLVKSCPIGQECINDACTNMKQRVLIVFDTSGSMNWKPGTQDALTPCPPGETSGCLRPYPQCEDLSEPATTLALSKNVFGQFFTTESAASVHFGLQRFPQVANDGSPVCEGGYNSWQLEMTGDDDALSLPLGQPTWFDEHLGEVLVVPFPASGSVSNVERLDRWMDGLELSVKSDTPCDGPLDCPKGVCTGIGALGTKTCRDFANPELRAVGGTPLGKSLFYAGEVMRRFVVIDGKPCASDDDCGSPGYYCSEAGECFDPLRKCRINAIVLFTDGGETEHPFTDDYFNPQVQAKRLRHGLGCAADADCSDLDYCDAAGSCHATTCAPEGYCTNALIEADPTTKIKMSLAGDLNRVRDYRGHPIDLIVNVVDASLTDPAQSSTTLNANRLIALYGGGQHVVVDVDDPPNFLAQLQKTIDFKTLFEACSAAP